MKKRMLLVVTMLVLSSPFSFGAILCGGTPSVISQIALAGGCSFGSNALTNVSISTSTESIGTSPDAIDPTKVQLAITSTGNLLNVIVSDSNPASWALSGVHQFDLILTYTVTGLLPAHFLAVGDSFNGSSTSTGQGTGAIAFDKTAGNETLPTLSLAMLSNPQIPFLGSPFSTFDVVDNIQVHAANGTATLVNATNSFTVLGPASVPEPGTGTLLGAGLLALGYILRRTRI